MSLVLGRRSLVRSSICSTCLQQLHVQRRDFVRTASPATSQASKGANESITTSSDQAKQHSDRNASQTAVPPASGGSLGLRGLRKKTRQVNNEATGASRMILGCPADRPIRTRFAPSPTGYLHLGSLRTALFNNAVAHASKDGAFLVRIEDTDQNRLVADAEERLLKDLTWAGLAWDEGPDKGGPFGPYRQSERLDIYKTKAQELLSSGRAYRCFCSADQLEAQRRQQHEAGEPTVYAGTCRSISRADSDRRGADGEAHVVRFKGDTDARPKFRDAIYGPFQKKDAEEDFVLLKTDGYPTYHFANVVDDHLMKITHVIRGEEWLISTPKHLALYEAFGWQPPIFAHLGLLVNQDGSKLSKRNAAVNLSKYQADGIFPMALLSWLANLGSSFQSSANMPLSMEGFADALTFKFTKGGIRLNFEKLQYFQRKYRDALLGKQREHLTEEEIALLNQNLIQPMLRTLDAITGGTRPENSSPPHDWRHRLEAVPALTSESTRAPHLLRFFEVTKGDSRNPDDLIQTHPYLFWRTPTAIYRKGLALTPLAEGDLAVLQALDKCIERDDLWVPGHPPAGVVAAIRDAIPQSVGLKTIHDVLRLVARGRRDAPSVNSAQMLEILGREEWRHRLDTIRGLVAEMEAAQK